MSEKVYILTVSSNGWDYNRRAIFSNLETAKAHGIDGFEGIEIKRDWTGSHNGWFMFGVFDHMNLVFKIEEVKLFSEGDGNLENVYEDEFVFYLYDDLRGNPDSEF